MPCASLQTEKASENGWDEEGTVGSEEERDQRSSVRVSGRWTLGHYKVMGKGEWNRKGDEE